MNIYEPPKYLPAITVKEISGSKIKTIPVGTKFEAASIENSRLSNAKGLGVTLIWNDEFIFEKDLK